MTGIKVEGILRQSADVEEVEQRVKAYEQGPNSKPPPNVSFTSEVELAICTMICKGNMCCTTYHYGVHFVLEYGILES